MKHQSLLKWIKCLLAVGLLPLCAATTLALGRLLLITGQDDLVWVALLSGAVCWVVVYCLLPKPMLVYVFGHELTHVLWVWLFGGRVDQFKATAKGGHVVVTKANFLVTLAPYFFPLYALLVGGLWAAGNLVWDWSRYRWALHFTVGAAYGFHVTMTRHILRSTQSDITENGYLFSFVVIWLGNLLVLLAGLPLLTATVDFPEVARALWDHTMHAYTWVVTLAVGAPRAAR